MVMTQGDSVSSQARSNYQFPLQINTLERERELTMKGIEKKTFEKEKKGSSLLKKKEMSFLHTFF